MRRAGMGDAKTAEKARLPSSLPPALQHAGPQFLIPATPVLAHERYRWLEGSPLQVQQKDFARPESYEVFLSEKENAEDRVHQRLRERGVRSPFRPVSFSRRRHAC